MWQKNNPHVAVFHFPRGEEKIPPKFHFIPPKFHFILPRFYFSPTWRISISYVGICDLPRGYTPMPQISRVASYWDFWSLGGELMHYAQWDHLRRFNYQMQLNPSFTAKMNFGTFCSETRGGESRNWLSVKGGFWRAVRIPICRTLLVEIFVVTLRHARTQQPLHAFPRET